MRTLYTSARIITMDPARPTAASLMVENGAIVALDPSAREASTATHVVDLEERVVVPGLIDAHAHLETAAVSSAHWLDVRGLTPTAMLDAIAEETAKRDRGTWIVVQATFGQAHTLPDRWRLDRVSSDHPVVIRASMHVTAANSQAIQRAGLDSVTYPPTGTVLERTASGELTGIMREAYHLFPIVNPSVTELTEMISMELRDRFTRFGVTSVYEVPMSSDGVRAFQVLERAGALNARVALFPAVRPGLQPLVDDISQLAELGFLSGFGNERLWFGGAKFFLDSVYEDAFAPARDIDHPSRWGAVTHLYSDVVRAISIAREADIQVWFHAIGVGAQQLVLDAAAEVDRVGIPRGRRTRVEHIFNEFPPTRDMLEALASTGIIPVPNPAFIHFYDDAIGAFPYRTMIEAGLMPPGNSDNSGTQPFATNPWFGIEKMCTRVNGSGVPIHPEERIGRHDALRTYTEFGAYAGHMEGRLGVLRAGALADFAALDADPFTVDEDRISGIRSDLTVVGGETVWQS